MILTYNKGEFVVNNVEIRKIICEPYYEYDYSLYPTCDISEMEAYINGVQIDIENELLSGIKLEMNTAIISDGNSHENDIMTLSDKPIYYLSNISSILG